MTEKELHLELLCYQTTVDDNCDIENLSLSDWAKFITAYLEIEKADKCISDDMSHCKQLTP